MPPTASDIFSTKTVAGFDDSPRLIRELSKLSLIILSRLQQRFLHGLRHSYRNEPLPSIQIVFAALINHSKIPIHCGIFVRQHPIDLVQFQRRWIILVVDANDKLQRGLSCLFHILNPSIAFVSYPCVRCRELRTSVIRRYGRVHFEDNGCDALQFSPPTSPMFPRNFAISRMRLPTAIGSISVMSLRISKSIQNPFNQASLLDSSAIRLLTVQLHKQVIQRLSQGWMREDRVLQNRVG